MPDINLLPKNDATNGWDRILSRRQPRPGLTGEEKADWLVLGAGYAGLAAARRLAELKPGTRIALVEAGIVGENASGRNSGFGIDLPHNIGSDLSELSGSRRYMRVSRAALAYLDEIVMRHGIACGWSRKGKYHAAVSPRGARELLEPFARELQALGEPWRWLDGKEVAREIGSPYYHAAVFTPGGFLMNPAALVRGLADSLPANVTLFEDSPVTRIRYGSRILAETPGGSVSAPRMILAVNAFASQFGAFPGRLLPFKAQASLTRPLTVAEQRALGAPDQWGLTPANAFVSVTMRYTEDHRILIRENIGYRPRCRVSEAEMQAVRRQHMATFHRRFPMLPEVTIENTWTGYVCLSRNSAPGFGRMEDNVHMAVCCNAVGVTKSTIAGMLAADMACGQDNPLIADLQSMGQPAPLPPALIRDLGIRGYQLLDHWRWREER